MVTTFICLYFLARDDIVIVGVLWIRQSLWVGQTRSAWHAQLSIPALPVGESGALFAFVPLRGVVVDQLDMGRLGAIWVGFARHDDSLC